ncbi:MAG TPA: biotin--[acetyl-CoA-carboxylase] ligase [Halanaerobiales bacterium]|nr:biotin--[acetyl-CoA-carboxylase] ligase [Halanaerobiales bacterium]HPZ62825.1 biotin--[acetyl-CoA-carboxylase] ligase [Halanaerobiales bacterium]HQD04630.1 biotin--[acetyl-CoA-carboxylase] ligase [Halanaerobiales bacterium]
MAKLREAILQDKVLPQIKNREIGSRLIFFDRIESTNLKAKELAKEGYPSGTVVVADEQTAGRGRLGRNWYSPGGTGLWLSIILRPDLPAPDAPFLTVIASLAVLEALESLGGKEEIGRKGQVNKGLEIKWPNDILLEGKKLAGILTELSLSRKINYVVVGIGINVNQDFFPAELNNIATSLKIKYKKDQDRLEILKKLLVSIEKYYYRLLNQEGSQLIGEWKERMNIIGKEVNIHDNEKVYQGRVLDIAERGELLLESQGEVLRFWVGDVSLRTRPELRK